MDDADGVRGRQRLTVPLTDYYPSIPAAQPDLLELDLALDKLSALDARQGRLVELRFFGGSMILANGDRTLVASMRGSPAALAFVDANALTSLGTVAIGGSGTFGDLAVPSSDGRLVYATFDSGANGIGGVAVVDVQTGQRLATWAYPGVGRPHGIAYSTVKVTVP